MSDQQQRHLSLLFEFIDLAQKKEIAAIDAKERHFFDSDFRWTIGGRGRISGRYSGWKEYRKVIVGAVATPAEVITVARNADHVFAMTRLTGKRESRSLDLRVCFVVRFTDGRIAEVRSVPLDDYAWDEFWS